MFVKLKGTGRPPTYYEALNVGSGYFSFRLGKLPESEPTLRAFFMNTPPTMIIFIDLHGKRKEKNFYHLTSMMDSASVVDLKMNIFKSII